MSAHVETPSYSWPDGEPVEDVIADGREPWDRPFLTWKGPDYQSREVFSPSGLTSWGECQRMAAYRYIEGIREFEFTWPMLEHRPAPTHKNKREQAKLTTIYNRRRGPALGKSSHGIIEQYLRNAQAQSPSCDPATRAMHPPVSKAQWKSQPGKLALSGLIHVPAPEHCAWYDVEGQLSLTSASVLPQMEPIIFDGYRDLFASYRDDLGIELWDWKTTGNPDYIPSEAENAFNPLTEFLLTPQPNIYAQDIFEWQQSWRKPLPCSWLYFRTKGEPGAYRLRFEINRSGAAGVVRKLALLADSIRTKMRQGLTAEEYPTNTMHCPKYGGCAYHKDRGGPCDAKTNFRATLISLRRKPQHERKRDIMGFRSDRAAAAAEGVSGDAAADGAADDTGAAEPVAAPRGRGRPPRAAAAGAAATPAATRTAAPRRAAAATQEPAPAGDDETIMVTFGGSVSLEVGKGTPLYARLAKLHEANFG